jgi:hypothetical protein
MLYSKKNRGQVAVELLFLSAIVVTLIAGFVSLAASFLQASLRAQNNEQAFAIAEAGISYYEWHLAYAPEDFQDGTGHGGPYVHAYYNKDGTEIGQFTLAITPPPSGSTIVTVTSVGTVFADSSIKKSVQVRLGIPSFAQYAWVLNANVNFGSTAQVYGVIDSNGGVYFQTGGVAHNLVESALNTYSGPANCSTDWAVYTTSDPCPPTPLPTSTSATFLAGREIGVPAVDFTEITQDLATIKSEAQASGTYFASSTVLGYDLSLATTSYSLYKVTALTTAPNGCTNSDNQTGWGTWSIKTEALYATGTIPYNGDMFFEDNLWVRGHVNGVRVTIAAGRFPVNSATYANITINSSTVYGNFNGSDTIAIISQNNINLGLQSDDMLTIDAALIAENGAAPQRYYYASNCGSGYIRTSLTTFGIIGSNSQSGLAYGNPVTSGYQTRTYNYDANLLYAPPPSFPLTSDSYSLLSWQELQ